MTSRGGGRKRSEDKQRRKITVNIKRNGVPSYEFTTAAQKKLDVLTAEIRNLPDEQKCKNTAPELRDHLQHPVLGICGWWMDLAAVDALTEKLGVKSQKAVTQCFATMGICKQTQKDGVYFKFDNGMYMRNGYKLHIGADEGPSPDIIFVEVTSPQPCEQ